MFFLLFDEISTKVLICEIFLSISIFLLILHGSLLATSRFLGYPLVLRSFNKLCALSLILSFILNINNPIVSMLVCQNSFIFDFLTLNVKKIVLISTILCLFVFESYLIKQKINNFEYLILILCAVLGLFFLTSAYDFISLYLALELQSFCLYVIAAIKKKSSFSMEAGLKYFFLGSFSSSILLFGISLVYFGSGTISFDNLTLLFGQSFFEINKTFFLVKQGLFFITVGFFFKLGAVPFHFWVPDIYESSPTSSTLFFAIVPKIVLFSIFLRIFRSVSVFFEDAFVFLILFFALFSIFLGTFGALKQRKIKRLLAYSSITHVGYLLLAFLTNSVEGVQFLNFYLFVYMLTIFSIWILFFFLFSTGNYSRNKTISDFSALLKQNLVCSFTVIILFFSLAGIPPFVGFFAKIQIFIVVLNSSFFWVCISAILLSLVSSFFYIRLIKIAFFETTNEFFYSFPLDKDCSLILSFLIISILLLFINPNLLLLICEKMALCLF